MDKVSKNECVKEPGVLDVEKMEKAGMLPSNERLAKGPIAVVECTQEIPCNPCETACVRNKLRIGGNIVGLPVLDETCTGCGLCIPECPGLAIFVVDETYSETEATVAMPYEFLPYPEPAEIVRGLNRKGEDVCSARVVSLKCPRRNNKCAVLTVAVPKEFSMEVRFVRRTDLARG